MPKTENDGKHIQRVVDESNCIKHNALAGTPCWGLVTLSGIKHAICNSRTKKFWAPQTVAGHGYRGQNRK